ncbi:MAG: Stk1 family PASTA domain-containing Ser/Thr kinase [Candidatus Scatovivens sp.]
MNLIGKMLDNRYEIIEKIGNGGMATVYKAKCHVLNRYVAVKILRDEFTTDSEFIKKFNTEAQAAASLTHPNIVSIFDVGNEGNLYYIVMELIQGKTLKEIIVEDGILSWKWSTNIAMQIASALQTAHSNGIIHRDIKPHNIIITEDGVAKVTDFGIAKAVSNSTITAFGTTIGSVHYFSPEHARGGFTDAKSDLYSLGVVMYEMLTGRVPFDADTPVSVALKQVQEEPVDPIQYNKDIPLSIDKIILKAMQKDPNLRYQSADEMLYDLDLALKNPDGNFVNLNTEIQNSPTQRVQTIKESDMEKKPKNQKKKNKLKEFFEKHKVLKVLAILMICGILFIGVMFATIAIINASRPKQAAIPNLVVNEEEEHLSKDEAIKLLEEAGFKNYKIEEDYSDEVEEGYVIKQSPSYQKDFLYNITEEITLTISKGSKMVTLPTKIKGEKISDIKKEFDKLEIKYNVIEQTSETVEKDIVIDCDQEEGSQISASTEVNLTVSLGSAFKDLTVTNVIGKTEADARKELEGIGFSVVLVEYEENTSKSDGIVLSQSVVAGKTIKENETITLKVNKLPEIKEATLNINVKSLSGYTPKEEKDEDGNTITVEPEKVTVKVTVGSDTVYNESVLENKENLTVKFSESGNVTIRVYIDGAVVAGPLYLDLNTKTTLDIN